jgi:hypothetical protein
MKYFILAFFTNVIFTHPCRALNFSSFVRKAAKVADNVPIHGADN